MSMTLEPEVTERPEVKTEKQDELAVFRKQDAIVADLRSKYMGLKCNGVNDTKAFDAVHDARMVVKKARISVEKTREELKAEVLERGRKIDAEAKRVTALLAPIESHLQAEEDAVIKERERLRKAADDAKRAELQQRIDALVIYDPLINPLTVADMTEEAFQGKLVELKAAFAERQRVEAEAAAERKRLADLEAKQRAEEAEARRVEAERLAADRAELERERANIEAEKRAIELEKAKQDGAEKARLEAEHKEQQRKADAEAAERVRLKDEAERPQREKLIIFAQNLADMEVPAGPGFKAVTDVLFEASKKVFAIANGPLE